MRVPLTAFTVAGIVAIACMVLAAATLWLLFTDPVTVANAVNEGSLSAILQSLANALLETVRTLLQYL
mgnify:FL=1